MAIDALKRFAVLIVLCLAQALVLNRMHLLGYATPLLYVYFVLLFPRNYPKWALLLWCFALGLINDTFSNTPGVACASLTLIGAIQPYFLEIFVPRDAVENFEPSIRSLSYSKYLSYSLALVFLYCLVFFALEAFNFFNWEQWILSAAASALLTEVLIMVFEYVKGGKLAETQN